MIFRRWELHTMSMKADTSMEIVHRYFFKMTALRDLRTYDMVRRSLGSERVYHAIKDRKTGTVRKTRGRREGDMEWV